MATKGRTGNPTVADAVYEILCETGIDILMDARGFRGALLDKDASNPEIRMLKNNLNDKVMQPFQLILTSEEIVNRDARAKAVEQAVYTLIEDQRADATTSREAIAHINEGIERYLASVGAIEIEPEVEEETVDVQQEREKERVGRVREPIAIPWRRIGLYFAAGLCILVLAMGVRSGLQYLQRQQQVVRFDGNGADEGAVAAISFADSGSIVLPDNGFERAGYEFVGWSENPDGDNLLEPGLELDANEPTTYYASWGAIVTFDGNGADGGEPNESLVAAPDGSVILPKSTFKRAGYKIWGWCRSKDGGKSFSGNTEVSVEGPTTFYALWRAQASFKGNGATGGSTNAVSENKEGSVTLPECGFTRAGCTFIGWYRADASFEEHPIFNDKDLMQPGHALSIAGSPTTLYACWRYDEATVAGVHVDEISRDGEEGKTYILLLRNDTQYMMDLLGEMRYVSNTGETLGSTAIDSPSVAPGQTVAQTYADYDMGDGGSFEYTLAARPPRHGEKSLGARIAKGEIVRDGGLMTMSITNTSDEDTVHILDAKAYGTQSGMATTGGFAYCGGEGYDKELAPGESTTVSFGEKDWPAPWSQLDVETYFDGYAE